MTRSRVGGSRTAHRTITSIRAAPVHTRDPVRRLTHLCDLADLLCLDLVVEARRELHGGDLTWDIRYDLPGAPVAASPPGESPDLLTALDRTMPTAALADLTHRGRYAPAHFVVPVSRRSPGSDPPGPHRLADRITLDSAGRAGAQAVWRDGRWWHTPLRQAGFTQLHQPLPIGHLTRPAPRLVRAVEPPDPSWQGPPVPYLRCPGCAGGGRTLSPPYPVAPGQPSCVTCAGTGRVWLGLSVTITDLHRRVRHDHWLAGAGPPVLPPLVAVDPDGRPVVQLPHRYRLGQQAGWLGLPAVARDPDQPYRPIVHLDGGDLVSGELRHGYVTLTGPADDPTRRHLLGVGAGLAAGRLLTAVRPLPLPPLPRLPRPGTAPGTGAPSHQDIDGTYRHQHTLSLT